MLLRLALSSALTADDAREAVLAQSLQWGYQARQPPLYNWLVWGAFRLIGPGLLALTLLKYAVLVLAFWLVYLTARRDPDRPAARDARHLLVPPDRPDQLDDPRGADPQRRGPRRLRRDRLRPGPPRRRAEPARVRGARPRRRTRAPLEVHLRPLPRRARPRRPQRGPLPERASSTPAILVAGARRDALVLPFALWFIGEGHDLGRLYAREVRIEDGDAWLAEAGAGLASVASIAAYYLAPVGDCAWPRCFPAVYRRLPPGAAGPAGGRLLGWLLVWMLALLAGAALAGGLGFLKARWLIPAFFLAPLYGLWRLERHGVPADAAGRLRGRAGRRRGARRWRLDGPRGGREPVPTAVPDERAVRRGRGRAGERRLHGAAPSSRDSARSRGTSPSGSPTPGCSTRSTRTSSRLATAATSASSSGIAA